MTVALDLDGTLLDCRPRQVRLAARLVGAGFDADRFWAAKRHGATTRVALEAVGVPGARAQRIAREWAAAVEDDAWLAVDPLLPGARRALAALAAAARPVLVLTARRRARAARDQVAHLVPGLPVEVVDPARAAAAKAAALRRCRARAFVGDTESDAAAAAAAAVAFLAVGGGQRDPTWLSEHGIAPVYAGVDDAVRALLGG